ncbi:hypothetical protein B7486_64510 [cyanobacterium TDX16]|nr:hypothetical protein B7486_64510 [cyanobacterium TDX16]
MKTTFLNRLVFCFQNRFRVAIEDPGRRFARIFPFARIRRRREGQFARQERRQRRRARAAFLLKMVIIKVMVIIKIKMVIKINVVK